MRSPDITPQWAAAAELAARQLGLVRRSDLRELGIHGRTIRRWVLAERLHELHPGVYAVGHRAISRRAGLLAAVWWGGEGVALSHQSAAAVHGWLAEDPRRPPRIHVTTHRNVFSDRLTVHRTRHLERDDVVLVDGLLWVTNEVRTLIDLADVLTYAELRRVADRVRELPLAALAAERERPTGRRGAPHLARLLDSEEVRTKSELERRFARYCAAHGLPHPSARNAWVAGHKADCVYEAGRLVVELDGRAHHQRRAQLAEDHRRDQDYQLAGHLIVRLMWEDTALDQLATAAALRAFLALRAPA